MTDCEEIAMPVRIIARTEDCPGGNCPTTYSHPELQDFSLVQGYRIIDPAILAEIDVPAGETIVAVPNSLLADHARQVRE